MAALFFQPDKRILIVEDHPQVRQALADDCRNLAGAVMTAANGAEALMVLESFEPDLIVLDMHMPVMDAREFAKRYHQRPTRSSAAIVLVSADEGLEGLAREIGAVAFIPKQDGDAFRKVVGSLIRGA